MKRSYALTIGDLLQNYYAENPHILQKIHEIRILRGWNELLGITISQSTQNLYIKNRTLYVSLTSSVLRNELWINRERLKKRLNEYAGTEVIVDIVIR